MKQTFRFGSVKGIPVGMHWSVLVILGLIADILARSVLPGADPAASAGTRWTVAVLVAVLFFGSLAAHELAHALVARRHGVGVGAITLWMLGGVAELRDESPDARAELRIAGVGPLTSAVAGGLFGGAWLVAGMLGAPPLLVAALAWLAVSNGLIAVFNLLPGAPLDGGRVLRALLWTRHGDRSAATRAASRAGLLLGRVMIGAGAAVLLLAGWLNGLWLALVGWFIAMSARAEGRWAQLRDAAGDLRAADVMTPDPDRGWTWQPVGAFVEHTVLRSRQASFPVVDLSGAPVGAVAADRLALVPARYGDAPLGDVMVPLGDGAVVGPDTPVVELLTRPPVTGDLIAVVAGDGRVLGIVTADDVQRLLWHSRLRLAAPAGDRQPGSAVSG